MKILNMLWVFALLSVLAVGGGTAVLPQMQHMTVDQFHWITNKQFRDIYSIGQVAPGPNMMMVLLIGYKLSGLLGAVVVAVAFFLPDCILTLFANRLWVRFADSPWRRAIQRGMAPVVIGLMLAGTWAIARLAVFNVVGAAISVAVLAVLMWRHVNPALLIGIGGLTYFACHLLAVI